VYAIPVIVAYHFDLSYLYGSVNPLLGRTTLVRLVVLQTQYSIPGKSGQERSGMNSHLHFPHERVLFKRQFGNKQSGG
jgi:hypothetical protein